MKFLNKKAILFDLDGTLINSSPDLALAINHMLTKLGRETFSTDTIHYWVGNGAEMLVKRALSGQREVDPALDQHLVQEALPIFFESYSQNLVRDTYPYPHVPSTLQALRQHGYRLAIVTNKPYRFVQPILQALELDSYFEYHLGGDSLLEKKPNPLPLLHMCQELGIEVKESVMVGDSRNDILAAKACEMQSIGLTYGYNYGEDIATYHPEMVVDHFEDILSSLIH